MKPKQLYVYRPLINTDQLYLWAESIGIHDITAPNKMHVTIAYSKTPVSWNKYRPKQNNLVAYNYKRKVMRFGSAVVLGFTNFLLENRWKYFIDNGCSWDYESYTPHVTLTYSDEFNIQNVEPFKEPLMFGPEVFEELDEDYK